MEGSWRQGYLQLKWTLFLTEARHRDASLGHKDGFQDRGARDEHMERGAGNAFTFLAGSVAKLAGGKAPFHQAPMRAPLSGSMRQISYNHFQRTISSRQSSRCFEMLVRSVISYASSELRKIKQRQEDIILASTRQDRSRHFRSSTTRTEPERSTQAPRNDIAMLFSFIGILFSALPPERALQFWGSAPSGVAAIQLAGNCGGTSRETAGIPAMGCMVNKSADLDMSIAYTTCLLDWPKVTSAVTWRTTSWREVVEKLSQEVCYRYKLERCGRSLGHHIWHSRFVGGDI
jgi:nuclear pore complex protein Nup205